MLRVRLPSLPDQAHGRRIEALIEQAAQGLDPLRLRADFLAGGQFVEHVDQRFVGTLCLMEKPLADRQAALFHRAIEVEQGFAQFIHRMQIGQVRAFAQGGQFVQQRAEFLALAGMLLPAPQQAFGVQQDVHALGEEVVDQLRIALDAQPRVRRAQKGFQTLGQ